MSTISQGAGFVASFTYSGNNLTAITDSLNRQITISGGVISFKGADGDPRTIKVISGSLSTALRKHPDGTPEYAIKTFAQLFPSLQNPQQGTFDIAVVTAVELPDERQYQFRYDSYGNLAQVILPTGGRIDYDWTTDVYPFADHVYGIFKRVLERRTALSTTATTYESRTTYSNPMNPPTNVTVDNLDPKNGNALLSRSKHYFHGHWLTNPGAANLYPGWLNGREYQTELFAADGTTVLRRVNQTYQQRTAISWWTGAADDSPPNDPRLVETTTTLVDTNQVSKVTSIDPNNPTGPPGFDQYNNQTQIWEYDFGSGSPGALLRRTVTSFVTNGYDAVLPNSTNPDISQTFHIRNLPSQMSIYDAGGPERARTTFEYDNYVAGSFHAELLNRSDISGHDPAVSTGYIKRGNPTAISNYVLPAGTAITSYTHFDIAGNPVKTIDPRSTAGSIIASVDGYSRITEVEAYGPVETGGSGGVQWLVSDHLGTPRMILDQTGALANMKRHDYLPFGEELFPPQGKREASLGYSGGDGVRQQFTLKERDVETGLDYFLARYYSSIQGRFTGPDRMSGLPARPQSWNAYTYVLNNPLRLVDPDGLRWAQRTVNGQLEYHWFDTEEAYNAAIDSNAEGYQGWTQVQFDETQAYEYVTADGYGIGGERRSPYRLNPDGTHGYARTLDGAGAGLSTDWGAQLAIGGALRGAMGLLGAGIDAGIGALVTRTTATEMVSGLYGKVSVQALESAASSGGPTVQVFTRLDQAPAVGRALHMALEEGGTRAGGQLFQGQVPKALVEQLKRSGLAFEKTLQWQGAAGAAKTYTELQIMPEAARFVIPFLK